jgi:ATP-dependent DNA ligase
MKNECLLYQVDNLGRLRSWSIYSDGNEIVITYGLLDGAQQVKKETVKMGLGGRTLAEQVRSRVRSRVNKQYDLGYKDSPEEARMFKGTNAMGMFKPMLAQPLNKVKNINYSNAYVQHKYDGHRCLITKMNGNIIAYSRQGKLIDSIDHILDTLDIMEGQTIDGELYCHGFSLQQIGSWIKREQPASLNLMFHAYDCIADLPFEHRMEKVKQAVEYCDSALFVPTKRITCFDEAVEHFQVSRELGYEGSIVRWGDLGYEIGKRSSTLVKLKEFHDAEFEVIDIEPSNDGWAILLCANPKGLDFKVAAPGSMDNKYAVWNNREKYIGKRVTVEYANLTADGVPFHPNALRFREDI